MMNLKINGQAMQMGKGLNITELLNERNVESPEMVSIELNERILRKEDFSTIQLQDGDQIEFLYFMGGGEHHNDGFQP